MGHKESFNQFESKEEFLSLLTSNQRKVFSYILSAVGRKSTAEEIMQQTLLKMWENFDQFERGSNFSAWGKKIAYYKILEYRRQNAKLVFLNRQTIQKILELHEKTSANSNVRASALEGCMKKLNKSSLRLISMRYNEGMSCQEISRLTGRQVQAIYKRMSRIYLGLKECIERTIAVWSSEY